MQPGVIDDPLAAQLDVLGWNQYLGWYYSGWLARNMELPEGEIRNTVLEGMPRFAIETPAKKPLVMFSTKGG